jgi:hypothetical protein
MLVADPLERRLSRDPGITGFVTQTRGFTLKKGKKTAVTVRLKPLEPPDSGKGWASIMPSREEVSKTDWSSYDGGVLTIRNGGERGRGLGFGGRGVRAKDAAIRVLVKKLEGENVGLSLRMREEGWYGAWFTGRTFGVGKFVKEDGEVKTTMLQEKPSPKALDGYFEFTFKAQGDLLTVHVDGVEVIRVRDSTHTEAGGVYFMPFRCDARYKKAEIKVLDRAEKGTPEKPPTEKPPAAPPAGRWTSIMPSPEEVARTGWAEYEDGVPTIQAGEQPGFGSKVKAKDAVIRVVVKKLEGQNVGLNLRWGPRGGYFAYFNGGRSFAVMKFVKDEESSTLQASESSKDFDDYFTFTFRVVGDLLTVEADGEEVISVRDPDPLTEAGEPSFKAYRCTALFKEAEVKVLDGAEEDAGERPPAKRWVSILPGEDEVSRTDFAEYEDGVVTIRGGEDSKGFGSKRLGYEPKDVILRVVVKKLEGQSIQLTLRAGNEGHYTAYFNGGRDFGVGKMVREDGEWKFIHLKAGRSSKEFDDYFEFTFKAEGEVLTVEADDEEVLSVRDFTHTEAGDVSFGPYRCTGLFKEAEIKVLD